VNPRSRPHRAVSDDGSSVRYRPRAMTWNGAGAWLIVPQSRHENFSRTCWITFH
jgi:hypothetical protein